ncbi:MAG TPA: hypothetical protein VGJ70_06525 [Solirubrobacteraceae bacterium]|jgi:hypothetical protein
MALRAPERQTDGSLTFRGTSGPPRRRGVLGGLVVFAVGFAFLLPALRIQNAGPFLFLALGTAFGAAYWMGYRQFVYLVPAALMIGIGLGLMIPALIETGPLAGPLFLGVLAAAFVAVTILAPERRWPLIPAVLLALIAVAGVLGKVDLVPVGLQPFIFPVVLMAVGAYLLVEPTQR